MSEEIVYNEFVQIPETIGFEETLVGPLTKTQVAKLMLPMMAGIGVAYAFHLPNIWKFGITGVCALVGAVFAFIKPGGVPLEKTFVNWLSFRSRPNQVHCPNPGDRAAAKYFVDVEEITGDTVKLPGELYARVVEVKGCNFEFMSNSERANVIAGYEQFLNAVDGNIQIVARPEKFSPREYHETINERLLQVEGKDPRVEAALEDYMAFFEESTRNIIEHRFFAVVCSHLQKDAGETFENLDTTQKRLEKADEFLNIRTNNIIASLGAMNLQGRQLDGGEAQELFMKYYRGGM